MLSRRGFLKSGLITGAAGLPLSSSLSALDAPPALAITTTDDHARLVELPPRLQPDHAPQPWQKSVRRVGQTNMTEHDPAVMDIEAWADYWHAAKADIVFVSVTGILAYYPSKVPFHRHGKYLNGRDFFGECAAAAKKRGMRVVARMSPDLNWPEALAAHPEWAMRHKDGSVQHSGEEPRLFKTCMFSSYMDDYIPAIIREVNSLYDVDCFYANGWPPLGSLPDCHCAICSKLPASDTPAYWRAFTDRVLDLWQRYDALAKERKNDSFFFANSGGNVRGGPNLDRLAKTLVWFQADNQGRTQHEPAIWGCSLQGRVCNAVLDGKFAANVTAAYSSSQPGWRNASKNPLEARMWLNQTLASGMVPYFHFVGAENEDRRWQPVGREYFDWTAKHDAHLTTRRSIANIGVVIGQGTQLLYPGPATARSRNYMHETTNGIYDALLRGRFAWDYVHEDRLDPDRLKKYRALLLPNVAMLSDRQCGQLREYVKAGGSLMASFETGLYDEDLKLRAEFGLADVFGISRAGDAIGTNGNPYYARIESNHSGHAILNGFTDTNWLPGAENRVPLKPVDDPALTVVPGFVRYPPELAYPPQSHTTEPAVVLRESGASRTAWFAGDVERSWWITGHGDLLRLMHNTIRWLTNDERQIQVEGPGFVEMFAWETAPGYAVHLLNYNTPDAQHGWLQSIEPLGPQLVRMKLPPGARVKSVELLRAGDVIPHRVEDAALQFTVPVIHDYEVAAVTLT
ncbi:alpha-amylase family protein [Occallatibacter riparius]|uniref:Beta-galactosidase trimerization domain-containing protein n=1 Tax=Occallatibacter riparius TaxID=1002689 RepID=A0A9J7BI02_9BACT|nr:alpha-amylase family protein [Occallatibacter riparius]UWZ82572.1 beta-galactosidase trimerization domain-containing protein [Occallatibacter riparius]